MRIIPIINNTKNAIAIPKIIELTRFAVKVVEKAIVVIMKLPKAPKSKNLIKYLKYELF